MNWRPLLFFACIATIVICVYELRKDKNEDEPIADQTAETIEEPIDFWQEEEGWASFEYNFGIRDEAGNVIMTVPLKAKVQTEANVKIIAEYLPAFDNPAYDVVHEVVGTEEVSGITAERVLCTFTIRYNEFYMNFYIYFQSPLENGDGVFANQNVVIDLMDVGYERNNAPFCALSPEMLPEEDYMQMYYHQYVKLHIEGMYCDMHGYITFNYPYVNF